MRMYKVLSVYSRGRIGLCVMFQEMPDMQNENT